jgi:hypothetical protein
VIFFISDTNKLRTTFCSILDHDVDLSEKEEFPEYQTLKIRNVESFYNSRRMIMEIKNFSSGLSSELQSKN